MGLQNNKMKNNKKSLVITFIILLIGSPLYSLAQNNGRIAGTVVDRQTQQPLGNVNVQLEGSLKGSVTDTNGVFRIVGVLLKSYNVNFSIVGYKKETHFNIILNAGNESFINIELTPEVGELKGVLIKSNKKTVRAATLETPLSTQRLTTEEIKSNPVATLTSAK